MNGSIVCTMELVWDIIISERRNHERCYSYGLLFFYWSEVVNDSIQEPKCDLVAHRISVCTAKLGFASHGLIRALPIQDS